MRRQTKRKWAVTCLTLVSTVSGCQRNQTGEIKTPSPTPEAQAQSSVRPASFKAVIENVSMYPVPNNRQDLAVTLVVSITNSGQPTIAKGWSLEVDSLDPSVPSGMVPVHVNGVVDMPGATATKVDLGKEDLVVKTADSAIGNNVNVRGVLTFVLPKTSPNDLASNSSSLVLHFKDAAGNSYETDKAIIGGKKTTSASAR